MKPTVVIFKGQPATGKSTLAKKLQKKLSWELFIRDSLKEELIRQGVDQKNIGLKSHQLLWSLVQKSIKSGESCVVDTNFNQKVVLDDVIKLERKTKAKILVIECYCSDNKKYKERFDERSKKELSYFWVSSWGKYQKYLKSKKNQGDFSLLFPVLKIDTAREIDLKEIKEWINSN